LLYWEITTLRKAVNVASQVLVSPQTPALRRLLEHFAIPLGLVDNRKSLKEVLALPDSYLYPMFSQGLDIQDMIDKVLRPNWVEMLELAYDELDSGSETKFVDLLQKYSTDLRGYESSFANSYSRDHYRRNLDLYNKRRLLLKFNLKDELEKAPADFAPLKYMFFESSEVVMRTLLETNLRTPVYDAKHNTFSLEKKIYTHFSYVRKFARLKTEQGVV